MHEPDRYYQSPDRYEEMAQFSLAGRNRLEALLKGAGITRETNEVAWSRCRLALGEASANTLHGILASDFGVPRLSMRLAPGSGVEAGMLLISLRYASERFTLPQKEKVDGLWMTTGRGLVLLRATCTLLDYKFSGGRKSVAQVRVKIRVCWPEAGTPDLPDLPAPSVI